MTDPLPKNNPVKEQKNCKKTETGTLRLQRYHHGRSAPKGANRESDVIGGPCTLGDPACKKKNCYSGNPAKNLKRLYGEADKRGLHQHHHLKRQNWNAEQHINHNQTKAQRHLNYFHPLKI